MDGPRNLSPASASTAQDAATAAVPTTGHPIPAAVERFQRLLMADYLKAKDAMDPGMMPEGVAPTAENIQVNLIMLNRQGLRSEFREQTFASQGDMWRVEHVFTVAAKDMQAIDLESLFSNIPERVLKEQETFGVLAVASAGCGKTFVFTLLAPHKWALKQLWPEFDIVVARELRRKDVREANGLSQLLGLSSYMDSESDRQAICDYVRSHPERVCIILDGLDEMSLSDCSEFVGKVLRGQTLHGIRLIVTSRPCTDVFALSESRLFQERVELVGFRHEDVEKYIRKVLPAEEADTLAEEVKKDESLMSMMATPFVAKETCRLYHHDRFIPRCVADIYERMMVQVAELRSQTRYKHWSKIPKKVRNLILDLGKFAFNMLIKQRLIFTAEDIEQYSISKEAVALGLLVACDPLPSDSDKQWRFSHLTMQESLAAKYQACCKPMPLSRIARLVESLGALSGHLRTFWVLLAAQLNKPRVDCLVQCLMTRTKVRDWHDSDMDDDNFCISDPFPLNFISPLSEAMKAAQMYRLAEELLSNAIGGSSGQVYVEQRMNQSSPKYNVEFLRSLLTTWTDLVPEAEADLLLKSILETSPAVAAHCRDCFADHETSTQATSLDEVDFEGAEGESRRMLAFYCFAEFAHHQDGHCSPLPSISASLTHATGCVIVYGWSHPAECRAIGTVLQHHSADVRKVTIVDVSPSSPSQLPSSVMHCTGITELLVNSCRGQWKDICALIRSSASTLRRLIAFASPVRNVAATDMQLMARPLTEHDLTASRPTDLISAVQYSPLTDHGTAEDIEQYSEPDNQSALASCSMYHVVLINCGFTALMLSGLIAAVNRWPHLKFLNLSSNPLGTGAVIQLCQALVSSELIYLNLSRCNLSASVLPALATAMAHWTSPEIALVLQDNDFSDVTGAQADQFIKAVNSSTIWVLNLPWTSGSEPNSSRDRLLDSSSYRSIMSITHIEQYIENRYRMSVRRP